MYNIAAPGIKFPDIYLYPWVKRSTTRVECLLPEEPHKPTNKINHLTPELGQVLNQ